MGDLSWLCRRGLHRWRRVGFDATGLDVWKCRRCGVAGIPHSAANACPDCGEPHVCLADPPTIGCGWPLGWTQAMPMRCGRMGLLCRRCKLLAATKNGSTSQQDGTA